MTSRSDGTNTTTYAWDEDNRLTLVTLPSSATVAYTYDVAGRMLTRTDSTGTTYFTWDGWNMVSELAPNGTQTRYYAPNGELLYFEVETATSDRPAAYGSAYYGQNYYGALVYSVVRDGLGSVRRIVDAYNSVVSTIDVDAWGNQLPTTSDPLNFPYRYAGAFSVRWDSGTRLYYAHNRWYDPTLQRFISRDIIGLDNHYAYCFNQPTVLIDIDGLKAQPAPQQDLSKPQRPPLSGQPVSSVDSQGKINGLLGSLLQHKPCPGKTCFLICTRNLPMKSGKLKVWDYDENGNPKHYSRHGFLVLGPSTDDIYGLKSQYELELEGVKNVGGKPGENKASISNIDYKAFLDSRMNVRCSMYCVSDKNFAKIQQYAQDGIVGGTDYYGNESTDWLRDVLNQDTDDFKGGKWPGYGTPVQPGSGISP